MTQTAAPLSNESWQTVGDEAITHLRALLRLDTRNPPGNEIIAANYLRGVLESEGIPCEIVGPTPDRATIVARLRGDGSERPLLLMSHTDVVAVERDRWTQDPFGAEIVDGFIYGRGALDMKNMVAMELETMLQLKRRGVPLKRDVIFMSAADEEAGTGVGAAWVVKNRPELIEAEYALNEGGGSGVIINGRTYYTVQTGEKGTARFFLRARGKPGHGSMPHNDNAIVKLAQLLSRIPQHPLPIHLSATVRAHVEAVAAGQDEPLRSALLRVLEPGQTDAAIDALDMPEIFKRNLRGVVRNSVAPTILSAGTQINVIPSVAEASIDARILPGTTPESFRAELARVFGEDVEIEFKNPNALPPLEVEPSGPLLETIQSVIADRSPGAIVVPKMLAGATDGKHVAKLGTKVYGFCPVLYSGAEEMLRIHGHDERVSVDSMRWGTRVLYEVVERVCRR